jgi:hypothetical protein
MEGNDIGVTVHQHVACWFEGLLMHTAANEEMEDERKHNRLAFWRKNKNIEAITEGDEYIKATVRRWRPNEMALKSVIHLVEQLGIGVEVYTYYDPSFVPEITHWLARKGAIVQVYAYDSLRDLSDDLKYNRAVHTLFTPYEDDAATIGWHRATVVNPDGTFGF